MSNNCLICDRIHTIKNGTNPYFVKELTTGYVVLGDHQFYQGYTLFLCKEHTSELHFLENDFKSQFLQEMSLVAEAVFNTFQPDKLNYELLGNTDEHLHWHIFPRRKSDPQPKRTIWTIDREIRENPKYQPDPDQLGKMKSLLFQQIALLHK